MEPSVPSFTPETVPMRTVLPAFRSAALSSVCVRSIGCTWAVVSGLPISCASAQRAHSASWRCQQVGVRLQTLLADMLPSQGHAWQARLQLALLA